MVEANPTFFVKYIVLALALQLIYSCRNDNAKFIAGTNSVVNHLENDSGSTLFLQAIDEAGFRGELDANFGSQTLLVPDNRAVQRYVQERGVQNLTELTTDELRQFVNYHRIGDLIRQDNFTTGYQPTEAEIALTDSTGAPLSIFINQASDSLSFNGVAHITKADVVVDNGILHFVDHVLPLPTIKTFLTSDPGLTPFYDRFIAKADTQNELPDIGAADEKITLFAASEVGVEEFFKNTMEQETEESFRNIVNYQFLRDPKSLDNLKTGYYPTLATEQYSGKKNNLSLYIATDDELQVGHGSAVLTPDLRTLNGIIESIDQVLIPPTIKDLIQVNEKWSIFSRVLQDNSSLDSLLDNREDHPYTVFVPTDEAFQHFLKERFPDEDEPDIDLLSAKELKAILETQLVEGAVLVSELSREEELTTLAGQKLKLSKERLSTVDGEQEATLVRRDIQTLNGVIHSINAVLTSKEEVLSIF